jgi:hypothetical protein
LMLTLKEKHLISKDTYEFSFVSDAALEVPVRTPY